MYLSNPRSRGSDNSQRHHALLDYLLVEKLVFGRFAVLSLLCAWISHESLP
jgi:hypothetical protein